MQETKIWKVTNDKLNELSKSNLDLEERIHKWIENDIKIILPDAILIGSKIKTDHSKEIDLLAIDSNGDLVIIELKRGTTPREVIAQTLDYAAWVATLKADDLNAILQKQGRTETIYELLNEKFEDGEEIEINERYQVKHIRNAFMHNQYPRPQQIGLEAQHRDSVTGIAKEITEKGKALFQRYIDAMKG